MGLLVCFFSRASISFILIFQFLGNFPTFRKECSMLIVFTIQKIILLWNNMQIFPSKISQTPETNQKSEHSDLGLTKEAKYVYVLKDGKLDGEFGPTHVYLSLMDFNQGSSKLVPCVFSVNWFCLLFRFQRMLKLSETSENSVCCKTYKNKSFI